MSNNRVVLGNRGNKQQFNVTKIKKNKKMVTLTWKNMLKELCGKYSRKMIVYNCAKKSIHRGAKNKIK